MRRLWLVLGILCACASTRAFAQDTGLELELDRTTTTAGQVVEARVNVSGDIDTGSIDLNVPPSLSSSRSGSFNSITVVNGRMTQSVRQSFHIVADTPGTYVIGPAMGVHEGDVVQSGTVTLTVQSTPVESQAGAVFVEASVDNETPYVGQQVTYSFKLYRPIRSSVINPRLIPPETTGLWFEEVDERESTELVLDGERYDVLSVKRVYFPTRTGEVTIGPAALTYQEPVSTQRRQYDPFDRRSIFDSPFFSSGRQVASRRLVTQPLMLDVQPLPPHADNVDEPIVGSFSLEAALGETSVQVGESATLELRIAGTGNVRSIPPIEIPGDRSYKTYVGEPETTVAPDGHIIRGEYRLKVAIVPHEPGELTIPSIVVPVFDPATGTWQQLTSEAFTIHVAGESEAPPHIVSAPSDDVATNGTMAGAEQLRRALLASRPLPERLRFARSGTVGTAAIAIVPPILSCAVLLLRQRSHRIASDPTGGRRRKAATTARKSLRSIQADDVAAISQTVVRYVADRLGVPSGSLTGDEALKAIRGSAPEHSAAAERIIRAGEASRYGGGAGGAVSTDDAWTLIEQLERIHIRHGATHE